jgi:hypothetical protein
MAGAAAPRDLSFSRPHHAASFTSPLEFTAMDNRLQIRFQQLHREMMEQFEHTAIIENHWLLYGLLGIEHFIACAVSHFLLEVRGIRESRGIYVGVWLVQLLVLWATVRFITGRPRTQESPLETMNKRIWTIFLFLCINVAILNVVSGQPIFRFMPVLATLSALAFACVTTLISRRFIAAGLTMFFTGMLMARYPSYEFLIYGSGWLLVLETLSLILWHRRQCYLAQHGSSRDTGIVLPMGHYRVSLAGAESERQFA